MLMACGCLLAGSAHAQWVVTDPTNLAQSIINTTKEIVQTSKTVKNTLDNFKEVEKLYNESKKYYDALKKVNNLVRDAQRVKETILMVGEISDIYVKNYKKMLCARLVGSVTTHWACALPAKRQPHAISIKILFLILLWILV